MDSAIVRTERMMIRDIKFKGLQERIDVRGATRENAFSREALRLLA